jgi:hypothetical protein
MNKSQEFVPLSPRDFAALGMQDVAYVKPCLVDGQPGHAIHTADGTQVGQMATRDLAFAAVRQHGLEPVSAH